MNKTIFKIFSIFVLSAAVIATILLVINFFGFGLLGTDTGSALKPRRVLEAISENLVEEEGGLVLRSKDLLPEGCWCMLIDESGDVVWSEKKPAEIPAHYSINDIARMTRWFLEDYPVYVRTEEDGLLVLGLPKNSLGKYEIAYSMAWFESLPQRILGVLALNLCLATLLALTVGFGLYRRLKQLTNGISDLRQEKSVHLKEKGIFKEVSRNLNRASQMIERKNLALAVRDHARSNWVAGISHDIRTPLSVVTGYAGALAECGELSAENRKKAEVVLSNSLKIKRLIEDLNVISAMEYDMQPSQKSPVKVCPLLRRVVTDLMNSGLSDAYTIQLDLQAEKAVVMGDEALLERAMFNLLHNAVTHNPDGCNIRITEDIREKQVCLVFADNGRGVEEEVLDHIGEIPKTTHGIGLPMAYRIITVHGGSFKAYNQNGFTVEIRLPLS